MVASQLAAEVRRWLQTHWDPDLSVRAWWERATAAGWQFAAWPEGLGGRGLTTDQARLVHEGFAHFGALGGPFGVGQTHGAPVILEHGSAEQASRLVPPLALGLESWCQLFSEPAAGSDLASVRTAAVRDGDDWIVNGQKVWTSGAMTANRAILLARTDFSQPKHRGLSFFVIDLAQAGVEVRPIVQINGSRDYFNEVFLSDARVPGCNLIGQEGAGWRLAVATLAFERAMNARVPGYVTAAPGPLGGALDRRAGDVLAAGEQSTPYFANRAYVDPHVLATIARERGCADDPLIRQALAEARGQAMVIEWTDARVKAAATQGLEPGVEANLIKLGKSALSRQAQRLASQILAVDAALAGGDSYGGGALTEMILTVPSFSIAGGTDEIQRNTIAERGLGLPRGAASRPRPTLLLAPAALGGSPGSKRQLQGFDAMQKVAGVVLRDGVIRQRNVVEPAQQGSKPDACLLASQSGAQTKVRPVSEGQVRTLAGPVEADLFGIDERILLVIGCGVVQEEVVPLGYRGPRHVHVLLRHAEHAL